MDTKQCGVIRDLLPLYHEQVCSQESRDMVEEHLSGCDACRAEYERIRAEIPVPAMEEKDTGFADAFRALRRTVLFRRIAMIALALALVVTLGVTGNFMIQAYNSTDRAEIGASRISDHEIALSPDGEILYHLNLTGITREFHRSAYMNYLIDHEGKGECEVRIAACKPLIEWPFGENDNEWSYWDSSDLYVLEDGNAYYMERDERGNYAFDEQGLLRYTCEEGGKTTQEIVTPITTITMGTREDHVLLWEPGMRLMQLTKEEYTDPWSDGTETMG